MGKNRPIVVATLGYIIGIIWGLYFKINIVSFYAFISILVIVVKYFRKIIKSKEIKRKFCFISVQKIFRYVKLILDFKSLILIVLFSSISNFTVTNLEKKYDNLYSSLESIECFSKVMDNGTDKEYKITYKIQIDTGQYKGVFLYLDVSKNLRLQLKYGDYISLQGKYKEPSKATNYKAFDYSNYLKTLKMSGTVEAEKIHILKEHSNNIFCTISNNIFRKIKTTIQENLSEERANLLLGILVGYTDEITEEMQENFKESNISHILAVSGLHVSYIILAISKMMEKLQGKRKSKMVTVFFIIAYMFITNFSPSVVRAGIMGIVSILANLTYNKNDIWTSIAVTLMILLSHNPYLITSTGVLLSYGGTIGIILFQKSVLGICNKIKEKSKLYKYKTSSIFIKIIDYIQDTISVSLAAQLIIAPIMAIMFNTVSLSFFITNFFVSLIIGPIIILGFLFIISNFLFSQLLKGVLVRTFINSTIKFILENLLNFLIFISKIGKVLPFNKIYVATPEIWQIILYFIIVLTINVFIKISLKIKISTFEKRLINWKNLIKHLIRKNSIKVLMIVLMTVIVIFIIKVMPGNLKIYFIDVGQGDSTLIVTPSNKTILIDGRRQ